MKKILIIIGGIVGVILLIGILASSGDPNVEKSFNEGFEKGKETVEQVSKDQEEVATTDNQADIQLVSIALENNPTEIEIEPDELQTMNNPKGEGVFVYHPETDFYGVDRNFIWLVLDGEAYALNGASKDVTPDLKWPREADDEVWEATGLSKYQATEAIEIVFE